MPLSPQVVLGIEEMQYVPAGNFQNSPFLGKRLIHLQA